jgi:membrane-bound lytic murein transglycosylase B
MFRIKKYRLLITTFFILCFAGVISTNKVSLSNKTLETQDEKIMFFKPVIEKLIAKGVSEEFILGIINDSLIDFNEKYVQIDVSTKKSSGTPSTSTVYKSLVDDKSVKRISDFIKDHKEKFDIVEEKYLINREVLGSLLWVETRHGDYLGDHRIVSVFLSLSLADQPNFIEYNLKRLRENPSVSKKEYPGLKKKLIQRSKTKADWAINELVSLYKHKDKLPYKPTEILGSYAGAFGVSQFIPSSFGSWAIDGNADNKVDLFNVDDAMFSAAHYLYKHNFGKDESQKRKAIFAYNHSTKYVNTIMTLAKMVKELDSINSINVPLNEQINN